ncbi:MAG: helix-turn-helix domain-containing protein [Clostridiales bacterium]|nr:helix-turn-helix domain-containing protein [Clostridiales bacterium]
MLADRIKELRLKAGMSQQRLGSLMGVSAVAVGKWERGQTQPDIATLTRLADLFGTTMDELCGRDVRETPQEGSISIMTRAFRQLTPDEQEKYIAVGRALFAHAFDAAEGKGQP